MTISSLTSSLFNEIRVLLELLFIVTVLLTFIMAGFFLTIFGQPTQLNLD